MAVSQIVDGGAEIHCLCWFSWQRCWNLTIVGLSLCSYIHFCFIYFVALFLGASMFMGFVQVFLFVLLDPFINHETSLIVPGLMFFGSDIYSVWYDYSYFSLRLTVVNVVTSLSIFSLLPVCVFRYQMGFLWAAYGVSPSLMVSTLQ